MSLVSDMPIELIWMIADNLSLSYPLSLISFALTCKEASEIVRTRQFRLCDIEKYEDRNLLFEMYTPLPFSFKSIIEDLFQEFIKRNGFGITTFNDYDAAFRYFGIPLRRNITITHRRPLSPRIRMILSFYIKALDLPRNCLYFVKPSIF